MTSTLWLIVLAGALSIVYGIVTTRSLMAADAGSARMQEISAAVREGAAAYLKRQYQTIAMVGAVIFVIAWYLLGAYSAIGFLIGAMLSGSAGFIGMNVSVRANVRVAQAATKSLAGGLDLAFKSGAVTGLLVAGLGLLGVTLYFGFLTGSMGFEPTSREVIDALVALPSAPRSSPSSPVSAAASSPRVQTLAATWSARSKQAFLKMTRATRLPSPTTSATTSATAPAWPPTCSKPMW